MATLRLHHVNVTSDDMSILTALYRDALGLEVLPSPPMIATSASGTTAGDEEWGNSAKFLDAGDTDELQIHATSDSPYLAAQEGHSVTRLIQGHFRFPHRQHGGIKQRLTDNGIPFDDWRIWSVKRWHQTFFTDPTGNMIRSTK